MDDLIFTHLSAKIPEKEGRYLFIPFGMLFDEVTASNLLEVDIEGNAINSNNRVNPAGWIVHRVVYDAVPDAQSVMHLHTITGTAVSAQRPGLLPVNQFGVTFYGKIAYHDYDGPGLRPEEQKKFVANLADKRMMFLRNHGTLTHGRSIGEAFILMHNLNALAKFRSRPRPVAASFALPTPDVIARTVKTAQGVGDRSFGDIGFDAFLRQIERQDPTYKD